MSEQASYRVIGLPGPKLSEAYLPMVLSKWLRSQKYGNEYFRLIDNKAYFEVYEKYIRMLLSRPTVTVKLAVLSDDPDVVLGFAVVEGFCLHYVYVNRENRKNGIATSLLPDPMFFFSHITNPWLSIWNKKYPKLKFNPFI